MSYTRADGVTFETGDLVTFWDNHYKEPARGRILDAPAPVCLVEGRSASSDTYPYRWAVELKNVKHANAVDLLAELAR